VFLWSAYVLYNFYPKSVVQGSSELKQSHQLEAESRIRRSVVARASEKDVRFEAFGH